MTVAEAARRLGISHQRVRVLIAQGRIEAERVGGRWRVTHCAYERRPVGRPRRPLSPSERAYWRDRLENG